MYVDLACCYRPSIMVCLLVYRFVTIAIPAKMAEPIEMLFVLWTRMGPSKYVLDGGHIGAIW